jgi:hypothetical protein
MFKTTKQAEAITHTLSVPSKMPGFAYNLPAVRCKIGSLLRKVAGSICSKCYAMKGRYVFPPVRSAMEKRFQAISNPLWVEAITFLISKKEKSGFFRWHDSGDVQDFSHLEKIVKVALALPAIKFWLPTREYSIITDYLKKGNTFPDNLCVRLSALMIDGNTPDSIAKRHGLQVSGVSKAQGYTCPAPSQGNSCGSCRACWDKSVYLVNYKQH